MTVRTGQIFASLALATVLVGLTPAPASAQSPSAGANGSKARTGMVFGLGVGGGELSCESNNDVCNGVTEGGSFEVHFGKMMRSHLALEGEAWVMAHKQDQLTLTHAITTIGARYWVAPRLWLKGGIGVAVASFKWDGVFVTVEDRTRAVAAIMAAAGYEVVTRGSFVIDVQLRAGTGFYSDQDNAEENVKARSTAFSVGFHWY